MQINYTLVLEENSVKIIKNHKEVVYQSNFDKETDVKQELLDAYDMLVKLHGKKLPTLREYLNKNACGAYHHFIFEIKFTKIDVIGVSDFEMIYNPKLLDLFVVVEDKSISNGGDCENYRCTHYLKLEPVEEVNKK